MTARCDFVLETMAGPWQCSRVTDHGGSHRSPLGQEVWPLPHAPIPCPPVRASDPTPEAEK